MVFHVFFSMRGILSCQPISLQDLHDAVRFSKDIYNSDVPAGYTVQKIISEDYKPKQPLKVVIAKKSSPPTVIICFQGTTTPNQLIDQAKSGIAQEWTEFDIAGRKLNVMKYYGDAMSFLNAKIENFVATQTGLYSPSNRYIFTGHSLGGGLASLYALNMTRNHNGDLWKNPMSRLVTFGQPRIGDGDFAAYHDQVIPAFKKLRIVYNKDIVPHVPYGNGFTHMSREIWIENKLHHRWEVKRCWNIPCGFKYHTEREEIWHVCADGDPKDCSNGIDSLFGIPFTLFGVPIYVVTDHFMVKYLPAVEKLMSNPTKMIAFNADQC